MSLKRFRCIPTYLSQSEFDESRKEITLGVPSRKSGAVNAKNEKQY